MPVIEGGGGIVGDGGATGGEFGDDAAETAQAFLRRGGGVEEIADAAAGLAADEEGAVPELGIGLGTITSGGSSVDGDAVCLILLVVGVGFNDVPLVQAGVGEALELGVDVCAVGNGGDAEEAAEISGGLDGKLVGEDVSHLVGDDTRDLVFAVSAGDELAGEVDASAGEREAVDFSGFDEGEVELDFGGRECSEQAGADGVEVRVFFGIFDGAIFAVDVVGHGFAQPLFLLLGEDVGLSGLENGRRRSAGRLGRQLCEGVRGHAQKN